MRRPFFYWGTIVQITADKRFAQKSSGLGKGNPTDQTFQT